MIVEVNINDLLLNSIHGCHPVMVRLIISLGFMRQETDVDASMHSSRITRINASMSYCPT
jgi:hypothetical protein